MVQKRLPLAFEIQATAEQTQLIAVAPDEPSWRVLKVALSGLGTPSEQKAQCLEFNTWASTDDPDVVAGDILVLMELVLVFLEFTLRSNESA